MPYAKSSYIEYTCESCGSVQSTNPTNFKHKKTKLCMRCAAMNNAPLTQAGEANPNYRHGHAIGSARNEQTQLYNSYMAMQGRCLNPNNPKYPRYGGRGISITAEWSTAADFIEWALANGYEPGLTIDRIDSDGNYEPGNCQWVTMSENSKKRWQA